MVFVSENGGITLKILVEVLKNFDKLDLFPCSENSPPPFHIVDGHHCHMSLQFIEYTNDKDHVWRVCFVVTYAASLWQVDDSAEQNGNLKILFYTLKDELLKRKI